MVDVLTIEDLMTSCIGMNVLGCILIAGVVVVTGDEPTTFWINTESEEDPSNELLTTLVSDDKIKTNSFIGHPNLNYH